MDSQPVSPKYRSVEELDCALSEILEGPYHLVREKFDLEQNLDELKVVSNGLRLVAAQQKATAAELEHSYNEALYKLLDQVLKVHDLRILEDIVSYLKSTHIGFLLESEFLDEDSAAVADDISSKPAAFENMKINLQLAKDMVCNDLIKNGRTPTVDVDETSEQPVDNIVPASDHALVKDLREKLQFVRDKMKIYRQNKRKVHLMYVQAQLLIELFCTRLVELGSSRSSKRKRRGDGSSSRSSKRKRRGDGSRHRRN